MRLSKFINRAFLKNDNDLVLPQYTIENINKNADIKNLKADEIYLAYITTTVKENGKKKRINQRFDVYQLKSTYGKLIFTDFMGNEYATAASGVKFPKFISKTEAFTKVNELLDKHEKDYKEFEKRKYLQSLEDLGITFKDLSPDDKLRTVVKSGIKNIWMVGPAGCGKSTLARNLATELGLPYLCISCGIGTSATEFIGYKYPNREKTRFGEYYEKPSVILIDEITALDPSVAQILNSALANDEIETTTGLVTRHKECIIIATSNTFGYGCDRQYVANNQLDASTIDRFIGGILEIGYSNEFESNYDEEVVNYANNLRKFIKENDIRKVISTRLIQAGDKLKKAYYKDWKDQLIINWSSNEKLALKNWFKSSKDE